MFKHYKFRTSLGWVFISFDPERFENRTYFRSGNYWLLQLDKEKEIGETKTATQLFEGIRIESGREIFEQLYDGYVAEIEKSEDGSLWAKIELINSDCGEPEYILEEVL